jgi:hypothetical protein
VSKTEETTRTYPSATFRDVVIVPYTQLLDRWRGGEEHVGGPRWPDWDAQTFARHCRRGVPADLEPPSPGSVDHRAGSLAWGGPVVRHFGHQVAEFSMRLLPTVLARPQLPIAFAAQEGAGWRSLADGPAFVEAILDWIGVRAEHRVLVTEPTLVCELFVAGQAEQVNGPGPTAGHLDALDALTEARLGGWPSLRPEPVYVSRAGTRSGFAGEAHLEEALAGAGARVMRPESLPLVEQIRQYQAARHLVFADGSAVHGLQLTGRLRADVTVLIRRPGMRIARPSLLNRAPALDYVEAATGLVHGLQPDGRPARPSGISILDETAVFETFRRLGLDLASTWDAKRYGSLRNEDVLRWAGWEAERAGARAEASVECLIASLRGAGLDHLTERVVARVRGGPSRRSREPGTRETIPAHRPGAPETILFMHIPKTASTSIRRALEEVVAEPERRFLYDSPLLAGAIKPTHFAGLPQAERAGLRLVFGHFAYGIHQAIPGPSRYVTMLRDPVDRVASLYYHYKVLAVPGAGPVEDRERRAIEREGLSLEEWVFAKERLEADNGMVRLISARIGVPFGSCPDDMLGEALEHIDERFAAVLVRGFMGDSARVLGSLLGARLPPVGRVNVNPARAPSSAIEPALRRRVAELNHLDVQLFRLMVERFPRTYERLVDPSARQNGPEGPLPRDAGSVLMTVFDDSKKDA